MEKSLFSIVSKGDLIKGILKMVCYDVVPLVFFEGEGFQLCQAELEKLDIFTELELEKI